VASGLTQVGGGDHSIFMIHALSAGLLDLFPVLALYIGIQEFTKRKSKK
jgi:hypothetical protein